MVGISDVINCRTNKWTLPHMDGSTYRCPIVVTHTPPTRRINQCALLCPSMTSAAGFCVLLVLSKCTPPDTEQSEPSPFFIIPLSASSPLIGTRLLLAITKASSKSTSLALVYHRGIREERDIILTSGFLPGGGNPSSFC